MCSDIQEQMAQNTNYFFATQAMGQLAWLNYARSGTEALTEYSIKYLGNGINVYGWDLIDLGHSFFTATYEHVRGRRK